MRRILQTLIIILVITIGATPAFATAKYLSTVAPVKQAKSMWCWAASARNDAKTLWVNVKPMG